MEKFVAVLIFNTQGEMAWQLRAAKDDSYALHWDFSAGGGIDEGEDAQQSAPRELQEELGITVPNLVYLGEHIVCDEIQKTEELMFLFKATHNGPFNPDPKEVEHVEFFSPAFIEQMLQDGSKIHPTFKYFLEKIYPNL